MAKKLEQNQLLPINHQKIIDGFNQLAEHINYLPFESFCGICDDDIFVTAKKQQYILEEKRVPVKMLMRGAILCKKCAKRRAKMHFLRKGNHWTEIENGKELLQELEDEERLLQTNSKSSYLTVKWSYTKQFP